MGEVIHLDDYRAVLAMIERRLEERNLTDCPLSFNFVGYVQIQSRPGDKRTIIFVDAKGEVEATFFSGAQAGAPQTLLLAGPKPP